MELTPADAKAGRKGWWLRFGRFLLQAVEARGNRYWAQPRSSRQSAVDGAAGRRK